jgi:hypothetical protein
VIVASKGYVTREGSTKRWSRDREDFYLPTQVDLGIICNQLFLEYWEMYNENFQVPLCEEINVHRYMTIYRSIIKEERRINV